MSLSPTLPSVPLRENDPWPIGIASGEEDPETCGGGLWSEGPAHPTTMTTTTTITNTDR